jgi:hypothetical protein
MKITSFGFLSAFSLMFICIVFPMFFANNIRLNNLSVTQETIEQYDHALRTAVQDAGIALSFQEGKSESSQYDLSKKFQVNKDAALAAFYKTLFINFGIQDDPTQQDVLKRYLPAIAVIDYDGFWINAEEQFTDPSGVNVLKPVWKGKKPFSYEDSDGNRIFFTLDDYVYAYDISDRTWHEGTRADVSVATGGRIQLLRDPDLFDQVRRTTILKEIQDDLSYYINSHNQYARKLGISYTFTLPEIDQEEWSNTIDDVGFFAFIQGLPVGDQFYNRYAFGGGRLIKKPIIYGAVRDGVKIYYRAECNYPDTVIEKFTSEKDAAKAGYFPKPCDQVYQK